MGCIEKIFYEILHTPPLTPRNMLEVLGSSDLYLQLLPHLRSMTSNVMIIITKEKDKTTANNFFTQVKYQRKSS